MRRNEASVQLHAEKYRLAWKALYRLNGSEEQGLEWKQLDKDDVRVMEEVQDTAIRNTGKKLGKNKMKKAEQALSTGEGQRMVS